MVLGVMPGHRVFTEGREGADPQNCVMEFMDGSQSIVHFDQLICASFLVKINFLAFSLLFLSNISNKG